jgi:pimeloyl-ACP methyl ester carboxylesterase
MMLLWRPPRCPAAGFSVGPAPQPTQDNPIHDLDCARAAAAQVPRSQLYVMRGDAAHWPQFEVPDEFNAVTREFFATGRVAGAQEVRT